MYIKIINLLIKGIILVRICRNYIGTCMLGFAMIRCCSVIHQLVKYLRSGAVYVLIKGQQRPVTSHPKTAAATKETMKKRSTRRVSVDSKVTLLLRPQHVPL